eukprot:1612771-Prymnesium_polylepis.3
MLHAGPAQTTPAAALKFIPTFIEEVDNLLLALLLRGEHDFDEHGPQRQCEAHATVQRIPRQLHHLPEELTLHLPHKRMDGLQQVGQQLCVVVATLIVTFQVTREALCSADQRLDTTGFGEGPLRVAVPQQRAGDADCPPEGRSRECSARGVRAAPHTSEQVAGLLRAIVGFKVHAVAPDRPDW